MGVGRSGTTAIYGLLQRILEARYPGDVDFVYEPFQWDRKTFNKLYWNLTKEFRFAASFSVEGMYHHKRIPMLTNEDSVIDQGSLDWLAKTLSPVDGKQHYLGKMNRANGRIRLIREMVPNTKIIFIIRNPLDVLNSSVQSFSLYGDDVYESDFDRFATEVAGRFAQSIQPKSDDISHIEAEYAYWYFSNLAFLEYAQNNPQQIQTICYEALVENRADVVRRICDFVGIDFHPDFVEAAAQSFGPVKQKYESLTQSEFVYLQGKVSVYKELLELVSLVPTVPVETLISTKRWGENEKFVDSSQNFNSLYARNQLRTKKLELGKVKLQLAEMQTRLRNKELQIADLQNRNSQTVTKLSTVLGSKRYQFINWLLTPLDRLKKLRTGREAN